MVISQTAVIKIPICIWEKGVPLDNDHHGISLNVPPAQVTMNVIKPLASTICIGQWSSQSLLGNPACIRFQLGFQATGRDEIWQRTSIQSGLGVEPYITTTTTKSNSTGPTRCTYMGWVANNLLFAAHWGCQ